MKQLTINPSNKRFYSDDFIKGFECGAERQFEADKADRPQGEWIFKPTFPNDDSEFPMGHLECSVCGSHHANAHPCNYCDNCGSRNVMKGASDES